MVKNLALSCKEASSALRKADTSQKNRVLETLALLLEENIHEIIKQNKKDLENAKEAGIKTSLLDRLLLNEGRIAGMAGGLRKVAALPDPVGGADGTYRHPKGMMITKRRVPLGVVGVIYEARPNVTVDIAALCIKSGNACLLRGGREALLSNTILANLARKALKDANLPENCVSLVQDTDRSSAVDMMGLTGLLDVLIPRGGAGLIRTVVENAKVPVIETGVGNCHIYVDSDADLDMAAEIVLNAKCSRPSVCNAAETLLVARSVAKLFLPKAYTLLAKYSVCIHGDAETLDILSGSPNLLLATEEDWETEYGDVHLAVKIVSDGAEAAAHIEKYGSHHSEAIVTNNYFTAREFCANVDAAAVYVNASTRFTDGEEFGLGAELGISTQKLHVRGPMGLSALTSLQYIIEGEGQVRT